jgi:hypothetical protein
VDDEKVQKFIDAAVKSRRILVSDDVYRALQARVTSCVKGGKPDPLAGVEVAKDGCLPPGTALTGLREMRDWMQTGVLPTEPPERGYGGS